MPRISNQKKEKISEQILHYLFSINPDSKFTSEVAKEVARDEEFTKVLLQGLQKNKLVIEINKNSKGTIYSKRQRWRLSNKAFEAYSKQQHQTSHFYN